MRILFLNTYQRSGGAAVAASRLAKALAGVGVGAKTLVCDKSVTNEAVVSVNTNELIRRINYFRFVWERIVIFCSNYFSRRNLFQVSIANTGTDISKRPIVRDADIIHIHWINQGFLSLSDLKKIIALDKPVVWTLHDLWPATAICHYSDKCLKYQSECKECPLQVPTPLFDLANWTYKKKKKLDLRKIHFVGCSRWITEMAKKSALLKDASFTSIPNPIDTSVFRPMDKDKARRLLHLPDDKFLLLFTAAKLSDKRKGISYLIEACSQLKQQFIDKIEIVLMGGGTDEFCKTIPFKVNSLGYIYDQSIMVAAYSCADLFVIPSLEDNLPNTVMESMACGTPCVGFDTGGIPEMIDHKVNGYVAKYKDVEDLACGIQWVLANNQELELTKACLEKVQNTYSESVVADRYKALYESLNGL